MNLRRAAQQALEAFVWNLNTDLDNIPACEQWAKILKKNISDLTDALQALEQKPVPSAWRYKDSGRICDNSDKRMTAPPDWVPLYDSPYVSRRPLTDYINSAGIHGDDSPHMVVEKLQSAINRAHGVEE